MEDSKPRYTFYCGKCGRQLKPSREAYPKYDVSTGEVIERSYALSCPSYGWGMHENRTITVPPLARVPGYSEFLISRELESALQAQLDRAAIDEAQRVQTRRNKLIVSGAGLVAVLAVVVYLWLHHK